MFIIDFGKLNECDGGAAAGGDAGGASGGGET